MLLTHDLECKPLNLQAENSSKTIPSASVRTNSIKDIIFLFFLYIESILILYSRYMQISQIWL